MGKIHVEFSESGIMSISVYRRDGSISASSLESHLAIFETSDDDLRHIVLDCLAELIRRVTLARIPAEINSRAELDRYDHPLRGRTGEEIDAEMGLVRT